MTSDRMRTDWRAVRVHPHASMLQTMAVISDGRMGIALVVDENDVLQGTVTDGDMRRAVLRQLGLDMPVRSLMERSFTAVPPDADPEDVLKLMQDRSVRQVPVCDEAGRVSGIYLMQDLIKPATRPNWVVIMAGGEGRRMWPITAYVPKPMLPVGSRPILETVLAQVVQFGFRRVFIAINYLGEQIVHHFGSGQDFGCSIEYLREEEPLGTGGALSLLPDRPDHPVLVTNGDLLTDVDLGKLVDFHQGHNAAATVCVRELTYQVPYGVVSCQGDDVVGMEEKPSHTALINTGIYVLDPLLLSLVPENQGLYGLPTLIGEALERGLGVKAHMIENDWMDVGHLDEYERVRGSVEE